MKNELFSRGIEIVTGGLIRNKDGKLLLTISPKWSDKWVVPGGHIDPGESILEATKRELEEETGLKVNPIKIFYFGELINSSEFHRPAHFIYFTCLFETSDTEVKLQKDELSAFRWVTLAEAFQLDLCEPTKLALNTYREQQPNGE
jgi:8-oxo-dGTP pyrophosphatase MutT (NUDIX family)